MHRHNAFDAPSFGQPEVVALLDDLILEAAAGPTWENTTVDAYLDALDAWLADSRQALATDSLEWQMVRHVLYPPGDFTLLTDYLTAVRRRVQSPADGWPSHLELPEPAWSVVGKAL